MRKILIALPLLLLVSPAKAQQTQQQYHDWCYSASATAGQTIIGCTELIDSGQYSGAVLSAIYSNRAEAYDDSVDADLDIQDSSQAVQLDPTNPDAFNNLCAAYNGKGDYSMSISKCSQAISLKPTYKQAYYNRGFAHEKQGNKGSGDRGLSRGPKYRSELRQPDECPEAARRFEIAAPDLTVQKSAGTSAKTRPVRLPTIRKKPST